MFGFGNNGDPMTYEEMMRKRDLASQLAGNVGAGGYTALGSGLAAGILNRQANKAEQAGQAEAKARNDSILGQLFGQNLAGGGVSASGMNAPGMTTQGGSMGGGTYRDAIASIESAGSGDYAAVGPTHPKMGRALGRYQVMEANIGPWSREALGHEVTPDEFMANPQLQDAIFDHQFGKYVQQYGPEGAAQAWFGGPGGVGKTDRKDSLGTSVGEYGQKFTRALGGGQGGPVVSTQGGTDPMAGMDMQAVAQALADPYTDPQTRSILGQMFQDRLTRQGQMADPTYQMGLERDRLDIQRTQMEMDQMRQPPGDPAALTERRALATEAGLQPGTPEYQAYIATGKLPSEQAQQPRPLTAQERDFWGIPKNDPGPYILKDGAPVKLGGGGVTVNNMPGGGKFEEAFAKEDATKVGAISEQAMNAQANIANIDRLGQMLAASPTGAEAAFKSMLGDYGVQTEGLDTLQSAQALINTMIPGQRQPGSGPMSDRDVEMFKASLPRLINSPGGNELILQTMRGIAEYDMQRGQIVQQLRAGQITREQAFEALGQLQNPLSGFGKQVSGMGPQAPAKQAPAQQPVIRRKFNPQTGAFE